MPEPCVPVESAPARLCRSNTPVLTRESGGSCAASLQGTYKERASTVLYRAHVSKLSTSSQPN
eukprot:5215-Eustigmatos_ZCMA.PRE.1